MTVRLSPMGEQHLLRQSVHLGIGEDDKLLVGRRVVPELLAFLLKKLLHLHGYVGIKLIGRQSNFCKNFLKLIFSTFFNKNCI